MYIYIFGCDMYVFMNMSMCWLPFPIQIYKKKIIISNYVLHMTMETKLMKFTFESARRFKTTFFFYKIT